MRENGLTANEGIAAYDYMALPMRTFARRIHLMADSLPNGFRTVVKSLTDDMDGPKGICWDVDEIERSDEAYEYKIHSCLYCDVCAEHGYPEFATVFCNHDIWAYGSLHKHVRFERFGTLADGDACCHDAFHRVP